MKKLLAVLLIITITSAQAQVKKVLFLGNSYTSYNNLPQLVKDVALSFGDTMSIDKYVPGGKQLNQHSTDPTTLSKIASQKWDNVVIQEQSQKPAFNYPQVQSDVYPYAKILCDSITSNSSCSEPVFYMTWGRKNGDATNCASYPPICTYAGMQQKLRERYMEMANNNKGTSSPVGVAWSTLRDNFPLIELYDPDDSHPRIYGSYLAACVFYSTLYQKSSIGSTYIPLGIGAIDALNIQTTASNTVLDSMDLWRINANKPIAGFNYNVNTSNGSVDYTNSSTNDITYEWILGDGSSSTSKNPSHTYSGGNNTYSVKLIIFSIDSCFSDTITQTVNIAATAINDINSKRNLDIYPNPANDFTEIKTDIKYTSVSIIDVTGKTVKQVDTQSKIDVSALTNGIYFIKVISKENTIIKKFVKR